MQAVSSLAASGDFRLGRCDLKCCVSCTGMSSGGESTTFTCKSTIRCSRVEYEEYVNGFPADARSKAVGERPS